MQKCLAKSISQEWQQIGQSDHKGINLGSTVDQHVVVCALLLPIRFSSKNGSNGGIRVSCLVRAMFVETALSEIFGPFGGMHRYSVMKLSRDDCVANFKIFQLCTMRGTDRYAVHNIHCSALPLSTMSRSGVSIPKQNQKRSFLSCCILGSGTSFHSRLERCLPGHVLASRM